MSVIGDLKQWERWNSKLNGSHIMFHDDPEEKSTADFLFRLDKTEPTQPAHCMVLETPLGSKLQNCPVLR